LYLINVAANSNRTFPFVTCIFMLAGLILFLSPHSTQAQITDTTVIVRDTVIHNHPPKKAVIYSLICPGLGQIYNRKYWKLPFIYGGGGAFLYYVCYNQRKYEKFRDAYITESAKDEPAETVEIDGYNYRYERLEAGRDYYRRYRDISIAGLGAMYLLNVIDAMVDAHFFYYDVSDDLSMHLKPAVIQTGSIASVGISINFGF
jgi:hypothetical protein